jgi:multiple sugar transport system permease protein
MRALRWLALVVAALISLFPFYWMLRTALAPEDEPLVGGVPLWPASPSLESFRRAWTQGELGLAMFNGVVVTGSILILQLLTCVPAAYVLAKVPFRGRGAAFAVVLACLLVPSHAIAMPLFIGINLAGLSDTRLALIVPFATSAFGIFLLRQQMSSIPEPLLEAARSDGLGHLRTLTKIVIPLVRPGIAAFAVFSVFAHWNDYIWPLLIIHNDRLATPPLGLATFTLVDNGTDYAALCAGAAIVTAPILVLFLVAQKQFRQGISGVETTG